VKRVALIYKNRIPLIYKNEV
jgi:hypothetical protein